jgi:hypothetical protein
MDDILISIFAIVLSVILMFIFPLMTMSDRTDDISQLTVDIATIEFVDEVRTSGKITESEYSKFTSNLASTGNTYNIDLEISIKDENPGRIMTTASSDGSDIGENLYYSVYTSQIEQTINNNGEYILKEGDIFSVSVKNTNQTISQQLKNFFYSVVGKDTYIIAASHAGLVTATGK